MNANVTFTDAQEMQKKHPNTFWAPRAEELAKIAPGWFVKVCANDIERFWVIVKSVKDGKVTGEVNNYWTATDVHGLSNEHIVEFELRHIYSYEEPSAQA